MKKLRQKSKFKKLSLRREARRIRRQLRRKNLVNSGTQWASQRRKLGFKPTQRFVLKSPVCLDLDSGIEDTLKFVNDLNFASRKEFGCLSTDLRPLKSISPSAALLLVAQCDQWRNITANQRLKAENVNECDPVVLRRLTSMGFFDILKVSQPIQTVADEENFLKFQTGIGSDGLAAKNLRLRIEALGAQLLDESALYDGLTEAMTNVVHHAYPLNEQKQWWMSASVNRARNRLHVLFVDHGLSIPKTLPNSGLWETIKSLFPGVKNDADMIAAAVMTQRTSTNESHRGFGLIRDIRGYIDTHKSKGRLTIVSRSGLFVYSKETNEEATTYSKNLKNRFNGTFLQWEIEGYGNEEIN